MRVGGILLDGSLPDLRGHLAALVSGIMPLDRLLNWYFANADAIEFDGSDKDVELLNPVFLLSSLLDALRADPLVQAESAHPQAPIAYRPASWNGTISAPNRLALAVFFQQPASVCILCRTYATLKPSIRSCAGVAPEGIDTGKSTRAAGPACPPAGCFTMGDAHDQDR